MTTRPTNDLPTLTEQVLASGERVLDIRGNFSPPTLPVRLVVKDADGHVISDEVLHELPPAPKVPPETVDKMMAEAEEYFCRLRAEDPERYQRLAPKLRRLGLKLPAQER